MFFGSWELRCPKRRDEYRFTVSPIIVATQPTNNVTRWHFEKTRCFRHGIEARAKRYSFSLLLDVVQHVEMIHDLYEKSTSLRSVANLVVSIVT
jgi:hypothetical protein